MNKRPPEFNFRRLVDSDLPMLHEWLNRSHVASRWDGPMPWERVQEKFQQHMNSDTVFGYVVSLDGTPMAYCQAYDAPAVGDGWWPDAAPGTWGIDQFLANESDLGRGLGTLMVEQFSRFVFNQHRASSIITDPAPDNRRAVRCYEKAGFIAIRQVDTPEGPALLMEKKNIESK